MDVEMPEMDGVQATGFIRGLSGPAAALPVIAVTANAMKGDRETYLQAGMNDYLTKPFNQKALEQVIARTLLHKTGAGSSKSLQEKSSFDFAYLNSLSNDPMFVLQMIRLFLEVAPPQLEELQKAAQNNDARLVAAVLHQLRPSLEVVGSMELAADCRALETWMKTGSSPMQQMRAITKLIDGVHIMAGELDLHLSKNSNSR
jgi:CheY-like chemotaxis protein